jgi:trehalose synthase
VAAVSQVPIAPVSPERFRGLVGDDYATVERAIGEARRLLAGRVIWHINSTARGGGVAEMLRSLLAYARGTGTDVRWMTISGGEDFFRITKRLHNHLHGAEGDGGPLGDAEREVYESTLTEAAEELALLVRPEDIIYLHDPQTAGLIESMKATGARVVWRCHVGLDEPNELARGAWSFLHRYVERSDAYVFSRRAFVWDGLDRDRLWLVAPSIDAFSPKNQDLAHEAVQGILQRAGIVPPDGAPPVFMREDGSAGRVDRTAELDQEAPVPNDAQLVVQVSRWDRLKDPVGLLGAFAEHCSLPGPHLLLAGPAVDEVSDDPEGAEVLSEVRERRLALDPEIRASVHLASLPMEDVDENAAIVNAIQRRADVVVQKSLAEGFGLTVAEAMWKSRPVIASRIGGIQDQIVDGESGVLIQDPTDPAEVGEAIDWLLADHARASAMGAAAHERVRSIYLGTRHLVQYMDLIAKLIA